MPLIRCQLFFTSGITGWSETYYTNQITLGVALNFVTSLAALRSNLMANDCSIVYQRVSDEAVFRDSQVSSQVYVGRWAKPSFSDPTFVSLLLRMNSSDQYRRPLFLRGIPDDLILAQQFNPDAQWISNFIDYRQRLLDSFQMKVFDRASTPVLNGLSIDATGLVTTLQPHLLVNGDIVRFRKVKTTPKTQGNQMVINPITATTFTVYQWAPRGVVNTQFLVQKALIRGLNITDVTYERLVARRTGRPFDLPRGRRKVTT